MFSMSWRTGAAIVLALLLLLALGGSALALTDEEQLGKEIFFDTNLSDPPGQSCASCHAPEVGWTGPDSAINAAGSVYPGAVGTLFGNRKPPSAAYGGDSPELGFDTAAGLWIGGMFWDGRATGWELDDPLAEQALGPFLNPLEQNMAGDIRRGRDGRGFRLRDLFEQVWGTNAFVQDVDTAYDNIGRSIAAYERSAEVSAYTSKYEMLAGQAKLTGQEMQGFQLFMQQGEVRRTATCRRSSPTSLMTTWACPATRRTRSTRRMPDSTRTGLTGSTSGWEASSSRLSYPGDWTADLGKVKVPTLRNVDLRPYPEFVKAYGHNGYFKSLEEIVHFYNTRDVPGAGWNGVPWPAPEVAETVNTTELGHLRLTPNQEVALVAFMKTLSDGYPAK